MPVKKNAFCLLLMLALMCFPVLAQQKTPWEKIDSREDVHLYERWLQISPELRVKERNGELFVDAGKDEVLRLLSDPARAAEWMQGVSSGRLIRKEQADQWYSHTAFSFPWPLEDRDLVCRTQKTAGPDGQIILRIESCPDAWPEKDNVRRFHKYQATWSIQGYPDGSTLVSYSAYTAEAPEYPRFILDPLVRNAFMKNLAALRHLLEVERKSLADKGR